MYTEHLMINSKQHPSLWGNFVGYADEDLLAFAWLFKGGLVVPAFFSNPVRLPVREVSQQISGLRARDYDITPDSKQFITIFPGDQAQSSERHIPLQIEVVLNWLEELKQRVPVK
jgi:hypothetical protein